MPVYVIDTLKPKNGLDFPIVEAIDVAVEGYVSLADAVTHFATDTAIAALTTNLQAQINQIAQAAGTGTADTEIAQARVGADGTSYQTLKARLDNEFNAQSVLLSQINDELSEYDNNLYNFSAIGSQAALNGKYIRNDGTIGDDSSNSGYYFRCEPNKEYIVRSPFPCDYIVVGLTNDTGVAQANTEFQTVIRKNNVDHVKFTTTSLANYIYYYTTTTDISNLSVKKLTSKVNILTTEVEAKITNIDNEVYDISAIGSQTAFDGKYIRNNGTIGDDSSNSGYYFRCEPDSKYKITSTSLLDYINIGFTSEADVTSGTRFNEIIRKTFIDSAIFTTNTTSNYVFYYTSSSNIAGVSVTKLDSKIDKISGEVDEISEETSTIKNELYKKIQVNYTPVDGYYINRDYGVIGLDASLTTNMVYCRPNTRYTIKATTPIAGGLRAGSARLPITNGLKLNGFIVSDTDTMEITTGLTDTYLYFFYSDNTITYDVSRNESVIDDIIDKTDVYTINLNMEHGMLLASGQMSISKPMHEQGERCANVIQLNGASTITIKDINTNICSYIYMCYYDVNGAFLNSERAVPNEANSFQPPNATYARFFFEDILTFVKKVKVEFRGYNTEPELIKNLRITSETHQATIDVGNNTYTFVRYLLPPNYTPTGESVPLILWMDGTGNMDEWGADMSSIKLPYLKYLADEGFAVIAVFTWGKKLLDKYPKCIYNYPYPTPTNIACAKSAVEWICSRYNVDSDNVHVMSKSQGGKLATYFATNPAFPIKSIGMFSPVCDFLSQQGGSATYNDVRRALADDMAFTGDITPFLQQGNRIYDEEVRAYLHENIIQIAGMNEAWTGLVGDTLEENFDNALLDCEKYWEEHYWTDISKTDIYTHSDYIKIGKVPLKIWGAPDDAATPYLKMKEIVNQYQNGGTEAHLRIMNTSSGGHQAPDQGSERVSEITTALGIVHTDVPVGWVENVQWIRSKMPK